MISIVKALEDEYPRFPSPQSTSNYCPPTRELLIGHELTAKLITRGRIFADNVFMKEGSFLSETPLVCLKSGVAPPNAARLKMSTLAILQKSEKITTVLQISYKLCYGHLQANKIMPPGH